MRLLLTVFIALSFAACTEKIETPVTPVTTTTLHPDVAPEVPVTVPVAPSPNAEKKEVGVDEKGRKIGQCLPKKMDLYYAPALYTPDLPKCVEEAARGGKCTQKLGYKCQLFDIAVECKNLGETTCYGWVYKEEKGKITPLEGAVVDIFASERCEKENNCNPYYGGVYSKASGYFELSLLETPLAASLRASKGGLRPDLKADCVEFCKDAACGAMAPITFNKTHDVKPLVLKKCE